MRSLLLLSCLLAVIAAQMISDTDIQRHLKAGGHNIAVDGAWGKGSHAAFDKWATDNFGSAYLNKRELYKSQGKSRYSIRHDEMFHSFWAEHPLPPHIPSSWSWSRGEKRRGAGGKPAVAMTLDDGPHPTRTPRILDILKRHGAKATFYVVGSKVNERTAPILRRMIEEGHEVGCHSYSHPQLSRQSDSGLDVEVGKTNRLIREHSGESPVTIRPPYGATNPVLNKKFYDKWGVKCVLWNVDPEDWREKPGSEVADHWVEKAHDGAILLGHDIHERTVEAIELAIPRLVEKYDVVTAKTILNFK